MMKKRTLLLSAAILIFLLMYFRPLSFPELSFEGGDTLSVNRVDLAIEDGKPHMTRTMYDFEEGSPEAEAIGEILARYSYRRSLRTLFPNIDLDGNDAGYWLHLWCGDLYLTSGGTREIYVNDHVYRMGLLGNQNNQAFMEEISAVLTEAEPFDVS